MRRGPLPTGPATSVAIGTARALTFDNNGNLLISAGSRIWSMTGTNLTLLAGNGTVGSSGDGLDPTQASIGDPEALAVDPVGTIYFPEFAFATVRKAIGCKHQHATPTLAVAFRHAVSQRRNRFA